MEIYCEKILEIGNTAGLFHHTFASRFDFSDMSASVRNFTFYQILYEWHDANAIITWRGT